ncbi:hypothetical protein ACWDF1_12315 [Streptomyces coelicoflavus]|uniref:hypothetical protein n=1 Tax=Streptomyces TaxID=1883 RepID=UPI0002475F87|nr:MULTISPECIES: hypothetical protein [Streptomyces]EHN73616.1 small hydrophilic protein [Streptomyces coelicoflavus ZG0656]MZE43682.1 hypothetical protein [Streptomyces sp. SID5477]KAF2780695.1 small hydrophilic protein [Streptomyces sp. OM5714]MCX5038403.1 hypothetical protein [Streptomyces coelicoflavus]MDI6520303.1 hypothetical protein [Streptomyces coelicoflavus]
MAKNKNNRDRKQPRSERSPQTAESAVMDREEQHSPQLTTPGDAAARKRNKRFGHN